MVASKVVSKYFSQSQLQGLEKAGDVLLPGTGTMPLFFPRPAASATWTAWPPISPVRTCPD